MSMVNKNMLNNRTLLYEFFHVTDTEHYTDNTIQELELREQQNIRPGFWHPAWTKTTWGFIYFYI